MKIYVLTVDADGSDVTTTVHASEQDALRCLRANYAEDDDVSDDNLTLFLSRQHVYFDLGVQDLAVNPPIVQLTGNELGTYLSVMSHAHHRGGLRSLRFTIDGGLKYKINEGMWTLPLGEVK